MPWREFDAVMAGADQAMVVVTTVAGTEQAGCLVGFHVQASITPAQYCVWLSKANHTYRVALEATRFAVHFLTEDDLSLAAHFGTRSGEDADKFSGIDLDPHEHGLPLLAPCQNRLHLQRIALLDTGGDHVCLVGAITAAEATGGFTALRVSDVSHLDPGRASEERAVTPRPPR